MYKKMLEKKKQIKALFLKKNRKKTIIYLVLCHKSLTFALAIVPWCNGSTTDFGSASGGSSPPGTTKKKQAHKACFFFLYAFSSGNVVS